MKGKLNERKKIFECMKIVSRVFFIKEKNLENSSTHTNRSRIIMKLNWVLVSVFIYIDDDCDPRENEKKICAANNNLFKRKKMKILIFLLISLNQHKNCCFNKEKEKSIRMWNPIFNLKFRVFWFSSMHMENRINVQKNYFLYF